MRKTLQEVMDKAVWCIYPSNKTGWRYRGTTRIPIKGEKTEYHPPRTSRKDEMKKTLSVAVLALALTTTAASARTPITDIQYNSVCNGYVVQTLSGQTWLYSLTNAFGQPRPAATIANAMAYVSTAYIAYHLYGATDTIGWTQGPIVCGYPTITGIVFFGWPA